MGYQDDFLCRGELRHKTTKPLAGSHGLDDSHGYVTSDATRDW